MEQHRSDEVNSLVAPVLPLGFSEIAVDINHPVSELPVSLDTQLLGNRHSVAHSLPTSNVLATGTEGSKKSKINDREANRRREERTD